LFSPLLEANNPDMSVSSPTIILFVPPVIIFLVSFIYVANANLIDLATEKLQPDDGNVISALLNKSSQVTHFEKHTGFKLYLVPLYVLEPHE
jgi:hypothetical protein